MLLTVTGCRLRCPSQVIYGDDALGVGRPEARGRPNWARLASCSTTSVGTCWTRAVPVWRRRCARSSSIGSTRPSWRRLTVWTTESISSDGTPRWVDKQRPLPYSRMANTVLHFTLSMLVMFSNHPLLRILHVSLWFGTPDPRLIPFLPPGTRCRQRSGRACHVWTRPGTTRSGDESGRFERGRVTGDGWVQWGSAARLGHLAAGQTTGGEGPPGQTPGENRAADRTAGLSGEDGGRPGSTGTLGWAGIVGMNRFERSKTVSYRCWRKQQSSNNPGVQMLFILLMVIRLVK